MMKTPKIFISYSRNDEDWKNRLLIHLNVLQKEGLIEIWDDSRIETGATWYPILQNAMATADIAILLISANYLSSDFIFKEEVSYLLQRRPVENLIIFPIILKPCAWQQIGWISKIQLRPKNGRPISSGDEHQIDTDFAAITQEIATLIGHEVQTTTIQRYPSVATQEQREELILIMKKISLPPDDLKRLYIASLPKGFSRSKSLLSSDSVLAHLWDLPRQGDKTIPVFSFIGRLTKLVDQIDIAGELNSWMYRYASFFDLKPADLEMMLNKITALDSANRSASCYLLIELIPDVNTRSNKKDKLYFVNILLWENSDESRFLKKTENSVSLKSIPSLIDQALLELAADDPEKLPDLVIEFFLPKELLSCDVDQWVKADELLGEVKLGDDYRLVVRSLERARNPNLQGYLMKKWQLLKAHIGSDDLTNIMLLCNQKACRPRQFYNELAGCNDAVCLGFTFMPLDHPVNGNFLSEMLRAGIPVALWPRLVETVNYDLLASEKIIKEIFTNIDLEGLLRNVQRQRIVELRR